MRKRESASTLDVISSVGVRRLRTSRTFSRIERTCYDHSTMSEVDRVLRFDAAFPETFARTPQGGAVIPAVLTRTGVFVYHGPSGEVREYRPPSEVFDPESLATLTTAPVTREHPRKMIDPSTYRAETRGNVVAGTVRVDTDAGTVAADLAIQDGELLDDIATRIRREVSLGYRCKADPTPGVSPEGERYDVIQRAIRYNHVAVVEKGRAGEDVSLRLDSAGNSVIELDRRDSTGQPTRGTIMDEILIDGVKFRVGPNMTEADTAALKAALARTATRTDSVSAELSTLKGRAESAEKALSVAAEKLKAAERYDATDTEILSTAARVMGPDYSAEGKTPADVMRDCVAKAFPDRSLEGKSDEYVSGLFDAIPAAETSDGEGEGMTPEVKTDETDPKANPVPENTDPTRTDSLARVNRAMTPKPGTSPAAPAVNPTTALRQEALQRGRAPIQPRG